MTGAGSSAGAAAGAAAAAASAAAIAATTANAVIVPGSTNARAAAEAAAAPAEDQHQSCDSCFFLHWMPKLTKKLILRLFLKTKVFFEGSCMHDLTVAGAG